MPADTNGGGPERHGWADQQNHVGAGPIQPPARGTARPVNYDAYILGPGDGLQIELLDLPELADVFHNWSRRDLVSPRLRALYVEGLTVEELRSFLGQQFSTVIIPRYMSAQWHTGPFAFMWRE